MDTETFISVLLFFLVVLFGTMIVTNIIASPGSGYVVIPSNRYCDDLGYEKKVQLQDKEKR